MGEGGVRRGLFICCSPCSFDDRPRISFERAGRGRGGAEGIDSTQNRDSHRGAFVCR